MYMGVLKVREAITSPSADSDLSMNFASLDLSPSTSVWPGAHFQPHVGNPLPSYQMLTGDSDPNQDASKTKVQIMLSHC